MSKPQGFEFGFISVAAYKKIVNQSSFMFFRSECITGGFLLTGATSSRTFSKGKRKGRPCFDGEKQKVLVTKEEVKKAEEEYESSTGNCSRCLGEKKEAVSWHKDTGNKYITCTKCNGL
jgi:hypothetical protein